MALAAGSLVEIRSTATASNVNGGGFNPANANMLTNFTATSANTSAPVVSTASYSFVASDVGAWFYVKSGTNWTPGWYQISSVSGAAIRFVNDRFVRNTIAGIATTASPTGGAGTVDYSQQDTAKLALTDLASVGSSTTITSATAGFTPVMVGNFLRQYTTGTGAFGVVGWYELVSYTNATTMVTDRTTNNGTAEVAVSGNVGGALSLGSSDATVFNMAVLPFRYFVKGGSGVSYTLNGTMTITAAGDANNSTIIEGYNLLRGDRPTGSTRPTFALGSGIWTWAAQWYCFSLIKTGSGTIVEQMNNGIFSYLCKTINFSATAGRQAVNMGGFCLSSNCEYISYRGVAVQLNSCSLEFCYIHDSNIGFSNLSGVSAYINQCIIAGNVNSAFSGGAFSGGVFVVNGCTLYGAENKLGIGLQQIVSGAAIQGKNNIIYGFATGAMSNSLNNNNYDDYNNYFNNTTDATLWSKGPNDTALNPQFAGLSQLTGTTATTTSGNHLVDTTVDFIAAGVVPGRDFLYIKSGTGVTAGIYGILSVDSATQITTDIALAANATANKVWQITVKSAGNTSFNIGSNLKGLGYPSLFAGEIATNSIAMGAVQPTAVAGGAFTFAG